VEHECRCSRYCWDVGYVKGFSPNFYSRSLTRTQTATFELVEL
jgi:hypothetical protein